MADVRLPLTGRSDMFRRILSQENLLAVLICLALIAIIVMTADQAPLWIYQGL